MNTQNIIIADLNDIIFDDRNKAYGAYFIRNAYPRTIWRAFVLATTTLVGLILLFFFLQEHPLDEMLNVQPVILADAPNITPELQAIPPLEAKENIAAPEKPEQTKPIEEEKGMDTQELKNPKPSPDAEARNTIAADSMFENKQPGLETTDSLGNNRLGGSPKGTAEEPPKEEPKPQSGSKAKTELPDPFEPYAGTMPEPINLNEIKRAIGYPKEAMDFSMEGNVFFKVLVDEQGNYLKHITLKKSNAIFERACDRHLKSIKFKPGKMGDNAVKVWVVIPFKFSLNN
jgi:protein TonB